MLDTMPIEPLEAYITRRGGLAAMMPGTKITREAQDSVSENLRADREKRLKSLGTALKKLREEARENDGRVSAFRVDRFAVNRLGIHPFEVFGDEWFNAA